MLKLHRILGATAWAARAGAGAALLVGGLLLSGCGQKGPLFMPTAASVPAAAAEHSGAANSNTAAPPTGR